MSTESKWIGWRTSSVVEALAAKPGNRLRLLGWVTTRASMGGVVFLRLRDGTAQIQLAVKRGAASPAALDAVKMATQESAIAVEGHLREDARAPGGKELSVMELTIIAGAEKWPITKSSIKSASFLYDLRRLSIRGRKASATMRVRSTLANSAFEFFRNKDFWLISAPTLVQAAVEGGATLFPLDYFGKKAHLSQSAQFYEEAAIAALEKVFVFQPAFRAEKSKTPRHLTEFWMIEAEQAFATQEDNMILQEDLVAYMAQQVAENRSADLLILGRKYSPPETPFPRISYDEVIGMAESHKIGFEWGEDVPTEAERLVSLSFEKPFFITGYPLSARSFYHMTEGEDDADRQVTLSADLIAPEGYGEIATGGQRVHNYGALRNRILKQNLDPESLKWYLDLRKYGMPPHSGFGIGLERTTRWICGLKHIRMTSLFPRTLTRIYP